MKHKHRPCPCGCGEMADECMQPGSSWLNAFEVYEDDWESHAAEQRHLEGAVHALGDDEWDDLPILGGDS